MQRKREKREEGPDGSEEEEGPAELAYSRQVTDGVCFSQACTCAGGRFSRVLHKGAMGLLGPDAAWRTHKLNRNYPGAEIYTGTAALLILAEPIISTLLLRGSRRRRRGI